MIIGVVRKGGRKTYCQGKWPFVATIPPWHCCRRRGCRRQWMRMTAVCHPAIGGDSGKRCSYFCKFRGQNIVIEQDQFEENPPFAVTSAPDLLRMAVGVACTVFTMVSCIVTVWSSCTVAVAVAVVVLVVPFVICGVLSSTVTVACTPIVVVVNTVLTTPP